MPQIQLPSRSRSAIALRSRMDGWFTAHGFSPATFEKGKLRVIIYRMGELITFKLAERPGHDTYFQESTGGALIVFEVKVYEDAIAYDGYCPLHLFGIWSKKLSFQKGVSGPFKYRDEGHRIEQKFVDFVNAL